MGVYGLLLCTLRMPRWVWASALIKWKKRPWHLLQPKKQTKSPPVGSHWWMNSFSATLPDAQCLVMQAFLRGAGITFKLLLLQLFLTFTMSIFYGSSQLIRSNVGSPVYKVVLLDLTAKYKHFVTKISIIVSYKKLQWCYLCFYGWLDL